MDTKDSKGFNKFLFNTFFPNKCVFCSEIVPHGIVCCNTCRKNITFMPYNICHTCLKQDCTCENKPYIRLISVYHYNDTTKNSIFNLKFKGVRKHADFLSSQMSEYITMLSLHDKIDYIIPVPMHTKDRNLRGYNQSDILSLHLSDMLNIPCERNILIKTRHTKKQHNLDYKLRKQNLINAYSVQNAQILYNKTVLLIDDVYTTGNTILQCCNTLQAANVGNIYVATLLNAQTLPNFVYPK